MAQFESADVLGRFLQGYDQGIEQKQQSRLMDMRQQAFDAEQSAAAQKQAGEDRDRQLATLQQVSSLYPSAPDMLKPHLYGQIVDLAEGVGFAPKGQLPRQLTPETEPKFQQFLQSFAGIGQKQPSLGDRYKVVGGALVDLQNPSSPVYESPAAPRYFEGEDGVYIATPQGLRQLPSDMGSTVAPPAGNYQDVYADIAQRHGSTITSGVRPPMPGVGAGVNSQHPKGTAADFRTNGLKPDQIESMMADLRKQGFEVIDERDNRNGRGPHIHAELPPSAGVGGYRPKGSSAQAARDARADESLRLAREAAERANRAEQRQIQAQAVTGKPPTEDERKAAGWVNQARFAFKNMQQALEADASADQPGFGETYSGFFVPERAEAEVANRLRSPTRQKYVQASSSFAEAALRAATGAGVNEQEARQKIAELTPQRGDSKEVRDQKFEALGVYLDSLEQRAGRALQSGQRKGGPVAGEIIDGYRFRGGNPNDQSNWERL